MIALLITLVVLALALWMTLMTIWWQSERGKGSVVLSTEQVLTYSEKGVRLARRGLYRAESALSKSLLWSNRRFASFFFRVFPNAEHAFAKRDELAGLRHGPSSYFLLTISEDQKKSRARRRLV